MESGDRKEIRLVLRATGGGDVTNCARVQFEHGQCVTTRINRPQLTVKKTGPAEATLYDAVKYQIEVVNAGQVEASNVVVTDLLPRGWELSRSDPAPRSRSLLTWELGNTRAGGAQDDRVPGLRQGAGNLHQPGGGHRGRRHPAGSGRARWSSASRTSRSK